MNFDYASFRADYIRKKAEQAHDTASQFAAGEFGRAIHDAQAAKASHYHRMSALVHMKAAEHQAHPPQADVRSAGKIIALGEEIIKDMVGSGLVDPKLEHERASWDWWQHCELWLQGSRRTFPDDVSTEHGAMEHAAPNDTEYDAINYVRGQAASIELARRLEQEQAAA